MRHRTTPRFRACLDSLPATVRETARRRFALLRRDPAHPSLRFKKTGRFWSVRAGPRHRALAVEDGDDLLWVWIGDHDAYERMIRRAG